MANTFTTNYGLTKSEIGANNDNWGTDLNNALSSVDTQINRKVDKADIVTQTSNKIAFSGSTITANSTTASTIFENFKAGDVISIAGAVTANNGNHTISSKTNAYTLVTSSSFQTEAEGDNTISYHLVPKYSEVDIDGGTIDGADVTVGSGKTLNVSAGTLTTSTAQKQAIVDGATIEAQDLTSASGTTLHSNITNNITTLGTVTAGTIDYTVSMTGVPRRTAIYEVKPSAGSLQLNAGSTTETVAFGSITLSAVSGKTYLIEADASLQLYNTGTISSRIRLYRHTSSKSRDDNSDFGTVLNLKEVGGNDIATASNSFKFLMYITGVFTASSTQTEYIHMTLQNANNSTTSQFIFDTTYPRTIVKIQEFDSDIFNTISS